MYFVQELEIFWVVRDRLQISLLTLSEFKHIFQREKKLINK